MAKDHEWPIIYAYTRKQAIEDGVLIDVTEQAKQTGFRIPVAVTDHLFHGYVEPPDGLDGYGQSITGRLHDVLFQAYCGARKAGGADRIEYDVAFQMSPEKSETVRIIAVVGSGDAGEPVLTIMLPGDD